MVVIVFQCRGDWGCEFCKLVIYVALFFSVMGVGFVSFLSATSRKLCVRGATFSHISE